MGAKIDLTGQKFGRLTVIEFAGCRRMANNVSRRYWACKCDCGNEDIIYESTQTLRNGHALSCGCYKKEVLFKSNRYDLSGDFGIGYTSDGKEFYFDLEDFDKISQYCWCFNSKGYLHANARVGGGKDILLHRLITNCPDGLEPDHIGGAKTKHDNRKRNLRIANDSENLSNIPIRSNNSSGVTGVSWNKQIKKWTAYITKSKKRIYLGTFLNLEDAINARKEAERQYFGEYAYDYSQKLYEQADA